ncbi:mechanosensitive ion channel family protein [bacterium]|nr:mechanosensitive ion channel family protein [bacterium]
MLTSLTPLEQGILFFILMLAVFLGVIRLTRHHRAIRQKIKFPLIVVFLLLATLDVLFVIGMQFPKMVEHYFMAVLYLAIAVLLIRIAVMLLFGFLERTKRYRIPKLVEEITKALLYGIAVIAIIQYTLNIQVTTVLATSAIITVVIGLALQETLGNLFAGLALQMDPAYQVGHWIKVGERTGKVEEVTWRATKLRTVNNDSIVIPNGIIAKETLVNLSYPVTAHAARMHVAVSYSTPPNRVDRVVKEVLSQTPNVTMEPPPEVRLSEYKDFSIDYDLKFYYKDPGLLEPMLAAVRKGLWYHFRRNAVEIPFPIRELYIHDRKEKLDSQKAMLKRLSESLRKIYLFSSLDEDERLLIAEHLEEVRYASGELIIREGEAGDSFFIIDQGEVEVFVNSPGGNRKSLATLSVGDFFGEIALLTGERRTASVQATLDVRVFRLKKDSFKSVLETRPDILDEISSVLSRRKDQLVSLLAESTGASGESMSMNPEQAKSKILGRIRSYFGL